MKNIILIITTSILFSIVFVSASVEFTSNNSKDFKFLCIKDCQLDKKIKQQNCIIKYINDTKEHRETMKVCFENLKIQLKNNYINKSIYNKNIRECSKTYQTNLKNTITNRKNCKNNESFNCEKKCNEDVCTQVYSPVCGKDNKTYGNECMLKNAGVKKDCNGVCPCKKNINNSDYCTKNADCKLDEFCKQEKCGEKGKCVKTPEICPMNVHPVCGCDTKTYSNECVMNGNRVNKLRDGACENIDNKAHLCANKTNECTTTNVCGWTNPQKIQCFKYPCANNYDNSCSACSNENVLYWTYGTCPIK